MPLSTLLSNHILQQTAPFSPEALAGLAACLAGALVLGISVLLLSRKTNR